MKIDQVNRLYVGEDEVETLVEISHDGDHIRVTEGEAYQLCHEFITYLHEKSES